MKALSMIILSLILAANVYGRQGPSEPLPTSIKSSLDRRFPNWKFLEVRQEIRLFLKQEVSADVRPDLIEGDFDGNGLMDYAMLIEHGDIPNQRGGAASKVHLLVYLNRGGNYKFYELEEPGEYLMLGRKGTYGFDFKADKKFKYQNDAIELGIFEKAGWTYVYEKGKFRYIYSAD